MKKPLHLIYITGLGDVHVKGQLKAVNTWHWYGVEAELFQVRWADGEAWALKFERLLGRIDELQTAGKAVALVAASAGASAAINAFAARKSVLVGVVLIAGKVNRPGAIGEHYRRENPAFVTAAEDCQPALASLDTSDRRRILSRFAPLDGVVTISDSRIPGARNCFVPSIGHIPTIASQISLGAPSFIHFLKRLQRQQSN
jgi:hypothetical protein